MPFSKADRFRRWVALGGVGIGLVIFTIIIFGVMPVGWQHPVIPTLSPERRVLAVNDNQQGRPWQALYHLEMLAQQTGWTPDLHRRAGDLWIQLGDTERALFHWSLSSQDDPLLLRNMATLFIERRMWTAALDTLSNLIALQPDNTWTAYHMGMILAPLNPERAEPLLRQAALDPLYRDTARAVRVTLLENRASDTFDNVGVPILIGLTMIDEGVWDYAELAFSYANTLYLTTYGEPLPEALAYISLAQNKQGRDGSAAIYQAVTMRPDDAQIRFLEALHYRHIGDYQASLLAMIQAVALSPENAVLYAELGTAYRLTGDLGQAEYWLRAAVAFSGNDPYFQQVLANFYVEEAYQLGGDGLTALDSAVQNNPDDPELLAGLGWAFFMVGDYDLGQSYIAQALEIAPDNPRAQYFKARILIGTGGDETQIRELLSSVIQADSVYSLEAQRILDALG